MEDKNSLMYETQHLSRTYGGLTDGQEINKVQHKYSHIN